MFCSLRITPYLMKQILFTLLFLLSTIPVQAQHTDADRHGLHGVRGASWVADSLSSDSVPPLRAVGEESWFVPVADWGGYGLLGPASYAGAYGQAWWLHEGFNAQFSLSATMAFGKHAPSGVGFGQTAAFAYLAPITPRLSFGAGIYATNMDWGGWRRTDVGIGGMLAYKLTDRINLYAYGAKTFLPQATFDKFRRDAFPLFLDGLPRDRFGAAAEFKIGNNAVIGVCVERASY